MPVYVEGIAGGGGPLAGAASRGRGHGTRVWVGGRPVQTIFYGFNHAGITATAFHGFMQSVCSNSCQFQQLSQPKVHTIAKTKIIGYFRNSLKVITRSKKPSRSGEMRGIEENAQNEAQETTTGSPSPLPRMPVPSSKRKGYLLSRPEPTCRILPPSLVPCRAVPSSPPPSDATNQTPHPPNVWTNTTRSSPGP